MIIYTDGSCSPKDWTGGWAWVEVGTLTYGTGSARATTNQRMELRAALGAVRHIRRVAERRSARGLPPRGYEIVSDSAYVVNCFREEWWRRWIENGWMIKSRPVSNADLWKPLVGLAVEDGVTFTHIRGHSGNPHNELCDALASAERKRGGKAMGHLPPAYLEKVTERLERRK